MVEGEDRLCEALRALQEGRATDDPLNGLILHEGLDWREVEVLRTLRNHLLQIRPVLNAETVNGVLVRNCGAAAAIYRAFAARFDPAVPGQARSDHRARRRRRCASEMHAVASLFDDEILRGLENLVHASLRTNAYQRPERPVVAIKVDSGKVDGMAVAAAAVRDLRALAQAGGHPPARRQGRARRHALERPPRRLPHRDPRADEDADAEERHHRPGRVEGRLRAEGPAAAAAGAGRVSDRPLPRVRLRPARRHRQPGATARSCTRPTWCATTTTIPTSSSPPTRARRTSPTPPTRCRRNTASGWATRSPRAAATATTTRREGITARGAWECVTPPLPQPRHRRADAAVHLRRHRRHGRRRLRQRHCCAARRRGSSPPSTTSTSSSTRRPIPEKSFAERARLFALPRSSWKDYDPAADQRGRRHLRARRQGSAAQPAGPDAARPRRRGAERRGGGARDPVRAGRPALQRRHRHLRQGVDRGGRRRRRSRRTIASASTPRRSGPGSSAKAATSA